MKPILFSIGNFHLYSFGLMIFIGLVLCLFLMERQSRRAGFPPGDMVFDLVFVVVFTGFLGGRLAHVLENLPLYLENPLQIFAVWEGGLTFYGGMITAFLGIILFARAKKISAWKIFDFLMPYVALTHAFGRLGCFLNGCCGGRVCDLPWAVRFPGEEFSVHPTQFYEAVWDTLLFLFLYRLQKQGKQPEGRVTLLYFFFYALGRFGVEFFRAGNPYFGPLTSYQWISLAVMTAAAVLFAVRKGVKV